MTSKSAHKPAKSASTDAISLLMEDHENVKKLFKEYEKLAKHGDVDGKVDIANQICEELTIHTMIEEEIFYPTARAAFGEEEELINEAEVEHATAKDLIAQIREMAGDDPMYDATVKVLSEYINHHVKEEETEMFPKAKKAKLDLEGLGVQLMERKEELSTEAVA